MRLVVGNRIMQAENVEVEACLATRKHSHPMLHNHHVSLYLWHVVDSCYRAIIAEGSSCTCCRGVRNSLDLQISTGHARTRFHWNICQSIAVHSTLVIMGVSTDLRAWLSTPCQTQPNSTSPSITSLVQSNSIFHCSHLGHVLPDHRMQ